MIIMAMLVLLKLQSTWEYAPNILTGPGLIKYKKDKNKKKTWMTRVNSKSITNNNFTKLSILLGNLFNLS